MKPDRRGFTLAELLIVIAIIAVLVTVGIPVFGSSLTDAKSATCAANRRSLCGELMYEHLLSPDTTPRTALTDEEKDMYACPTGGTITAEFDTATGRYTVNCSKHASGILSPAQIQGVFDSMGYDIFTALRPGGTKYSAALSDPNSDASRAVAELTAKGIDLPSMGIKTWGFGTEKLWWTTVDITQYSTSEKIPVIVYNNSASGQKFSVRYGKRDSQDQLVWRSGSSGNVTGSNGSVIGNISYEDALAEYNRLISP